MSAAIADIAPVAARRFKVLTFTTLFPNAAEPGRGIFVETRLRHLLASGRVDVRVIAPVPWFPFKHPRFGQYGTFARAPRREIRHGIEVDHPRFPTIPKVGMTLAPSLLARWAAPAVRQLLDTGFDFDLIDAHYYYPDGVAAIEIGRALDKPVVITARGTDVNLIPQYARPRAMITAAAREAGASIAVCQALKDEMMSIGMDGAKIHVLRNGVDLVKFTPQPMADARAKLGWPLATKTALSVGYLIERKGHHFAIEALPALPDWRLVIAGDGEMRGALQALAERCGVADRVQFAGAVPQSQLRDYYCAADLLVLASSREGMANVLLESLACGTPVVATAVWGTPEVIAVPEAGELMRERDAASLAEAVQRLVARPTDRAATRRYAEQFSWDRTTQGQLDVFEQITRR